MESIATACAFRIGPFAVGISPQVLHVHHNAAFPYGNELWRAGKGFSAYNFEYKQEGWTVSAKAGVMWLFSDKLRIGATIQAPYKTDLKGWARSNMFADNDSVSAKKIDLNAQWCMPMSMGIGIVRQIGIYSEINADFIMDFWKSDSKSMDFSFSDPQWETRLTAADSIAGIQGSSWLTEFQNAIHMGVGFEYAPAKGLIYRAGYRISTSPNTGHTYNLFFPGVSQHWFSCGIGYVSGHSVVDLSIAYSFGIAKNVQQDRPFVSGKYDSYTVLPALSYQYQF